MGEMTMDPVLCMNEMPLEELDSVFDKVYPMDSLITNADFKRKRSDSNNSVIFRKNSKSKPINESIENYLNLKDLDDELVSLSSDLSLPLIKSLNLSVKDLENPSKPINVWRFKIQGICVYISWLSQAGTLGKLDTGIPLLRRVDNSLVNATLLLHAAGVSEKETSLICSFERKVRCSNTNSPLYGLWIPLKRAKTLAMSLSLGKIDIFLSDNLSEYFSPLKSNKIQGQTQLLLNHLISKLSQLKNAEPNSTFINGIASLLPGILAKSTQPITSMNSLVSTLNQLLSKPKQKSTPPYKKRIVQFQDSESD